MARSSIGDGFSGYGRWGPRKIDGLDWLSAALTTGGAWAQASDLIADPAGLRPDVVVLRFGVDRSGS